MVEKVVLCIARTVPPEQRLVYLLYKEGVWTCLEFLSVCHQMNLI